MEKQLGHMKKADNAHRHLCRGKIDFPMEICSTIFSESVASYVKYQFFFQDIILFFTMFQKTFHN